MNHKLTEVADGYTIHWIPEIQTWGADCHWCWITQASGDDRDLIQTQIQHHIRHCPDRHTSTNHMR